MTLIGAATVYIEIPRKNLRLASCFCLATASGVMAYVSLVEVFGEAQDNFSEAFEKLYEGLEEKKREKIVGTYALLCASGTFFAGWFIALAMDWARVLDKFYNYSYYSNFTSKILKSGKI